MTDKELIKRRFASTFGQYDLLAHTQREICRRLDAMAACLPSPSRAMEIGAGTGFLTRFLLDRYPSSHWILNDLAEASEPFLRPIACGVEREYLWGDAERLRFPAGLDMIATASTVQWFDDLPAFLDKCAAATAPGGTLLLSTFGPENFMEIKTLTGQGLEYYTLAGLLDAAGRAGYEIIRSGEDICRVGFASPMEVLRHIRSTGVNSIDKRCWTRGRLEDFSARYIKEFTTPEGGVSLTYHPVLIAARRPL